LGSVHFPGKSKQTIRRLVDSSGKNFVQTDFHTNVQLFEKVFAPDESTNRLIEKVKRGTGPRGCNRKGGATPAQLTGGAAALELRGGLIPAARSRTTPVREFLSPSLRPHKGDSVSAAATKLREPVAIYFFFRGFPSNLKRGHRHGLAQLRGGGAYRIPLMRPQARRQELSNWCCP